MTGLRVDPASPICTSGKRGFATEAQARAALQQVRAARGRGATARRPGRTEAACYRCGACSWWHLTSSSGRRTRRSDHLE